MENTMMNVHICSTRKTDEPLMLNVFKAYKLNRGFVPCEPDEADQTYLVSYLRSDICSWLTVSSTHWHDDSFEAFYALLIYTHFHHSFPIIKPYSS